MRILQATSEFFPYSKTGGLADMVSGLSGALADIGEDVTVATPLYQGIRDKFPQISPAGDAFIIELGDSRVVGRWWKLKAGRLDLCFLENEFFFDRPGLYMENGEGYADNPDRYIFFSRAVATMAGAFDLVHVHDWQAAMVAMLLKEQGGGRPHSVFTIHNLAYQGTCDGAKFGLTGLSPELFHQRGPEHFGGFNFLKAGLYYADAITTVSPQYAKEIQTSEFGEGLDGELRNHAGKLTGILNGVDYSEWRTVGNPHLAASYDVTDLSGKTRCKEAALKEFGLPDLSLPLFGVVSRLADQKGIDHLLQVLAEQLPEKAFQLIILGSGDLRLAEQILQLQAVYPDVLAAHIGYNQALSHVIEAGSDFFVMPSRFEPCGLNQLYSLRYGTVPIVHSVGGLLDSVPDIDTELGLGITYSGHSPENLSSAIIRAVKFFGEPEIFLNTAREGMACDFSWESSAQKYSQIFTELTKTAKSPK